MSDLPTCPICATSCDISEEDLIDADCGACGSVTIHVHCKEKYCRQQGVPKGQYKGYTCPQCTRAKVSAQHHRQRDKKKKPASGDKASRVNEQPSSGTYVQAAPQKEPILNVQALVDAVVADSQADQTTLQPLRQSFKRLLQIQRVFKAEEDQLVNIWKPFSHRNLQGFYKSLRGHDQPAYVQATSLLKLTSSMSVDGESEEVQKKREEVAKVLIELISHSILDALDGAQEYGRCQALYDDVVQKLDALSRQCESATFYLERLRKSLPAQLISLDESTQERMWWGCDVHDATSNGVVLCLINPHNTSDEHQLRSPPFYVNGVPWTVRFYKTKTQGSELQSMAAYLDANTALRENPAFEQQVTFTFTVRKSLEHKGDAVCRKEATFVFKKDSDNRGWRECVPVTAVEGGRLYLFVEVREGAVGENINIAVRLKGVDDKLGEVRFKVKQSMALSKLMESYCTRHHLRPDKVKFFWTDGKGGAEKAVGPEQTPSDLGVSGEDLNIWAECKDDEIGIIMKKVAGVNLLEAAEAMEKCAFQPRKAIQMLSSMMQAKAKAEAAKKVEEEGAAKEPVEEKEVVKTTFQDPAPLVISSNFAKKDKGGKGPATPKEGEGSENDSSQDKPASVEKEGSKAGKSGRETGEGKGEGEGYEEVKGKKKKESKGRQDKEKDKEKDKDEGGEGAGAKGGEKAPFGGRKVFIGGTADKDHDELKEHFGQFGEVASVEVLKERDGSFRGFAFVTFYDIKAAQGLLEAHHSYIGNVRMEAKPCVQPRGELELDRKIEALLSVPGGTTTPRHQDPPPPAVSAWGLGPPAVKFSSPLAAVGAAGKDDVDLTEWKQADDAGWPSIGNLGDMFDPEAQPAVGGTSTSASASQASTADTAAAGTAGWDTAGSSMDAPVPLGLESMLDFDDEENICTICFENLANACLKPCDHKFCAVCIKQLKKQAIFLPIEGVRCPSCRATVKDFVIPAAGPQPPTNSAQGSKTVWGSSGAQPAQPPQPSPAAAATAPATAALPSLSTATPTAALTPSNAGVGALWGGPATAGADIWGGSGLGASNSFGLPGQSEAGGGGRGLWGGGLGGGTFGADPLFARGGGVSGLGGGASWSNFGGIGDGLGDAGSMWSAGGAEADGGFGGGWSGAFNVPSGFGGGSLRPMGDMQLEDASVGVGQGSLWEGAGTTPRRGVSPEARGGAGGPQARFNGAGGGGEGGETIEVKVKLSDEREVNLVARPTDTGRRLRLQIKEVTGTPVSCQRLFFQGKILEHAETLGDKKIVSGVVINCFPREAQPGEEEAIMAEEAGMPPPKAPVPDPKPTASSSKGKHGGGSKQSGAAGQPASTLSGGGDGILGSLSGDGRSKGRAVAAGVIGSAALLAPPAVPPPAAVPVLQLQPDPSAGRGGVEDTRSEDESEVGSVASRGLSQDDTVWEAVATKKKKKGKGGGNTGVQPSGAGVLDAPVGLAPMAVGSGALGAIGSVVGGEKAANWPKGRAHFFGLWVGNVHSEVVEQEEFRAAFERFGELCNAKAHGVPPINILPPSSSAFVNFCRYEDADAARTALQGKTVGCTGPLRINASDLMQKYEEEVVIPARKRQEAARQPTWSAVEADGAGLGGWLGGGQAEGQPQPREEEWQRVEQAPREAEGREDGAGSVMSVERQREAERVEQERRDHEFALKLQRQEQYEASNAALIANAQRRARIHIGGSAGVAAQAQAQGWAAPTVGTPTGRTMPRTGLEEGPPGLMHSMSTPLPGDERAPGNRGTLMDHLPQQLRGGDAGGPRGAAPNAWGVKKGEGADGVLPLPGAAGQVPRGGILNAPAGWSAMGNGMGGMAGAGRGGWSDQGATGWGAGQGDEQWETAAPKRKGRGRKGDDGEGGGDDFLFGMP